MYVLFQHHEKVNMDFLFMQSVSERDASWKSQNFKRSQNWVGRQSITSKGPRIQKIFTNLERGTCFDALAALQ